MTTTEERVLESALVAARQARLGAEKALDAVLSAPRRSDRGDVPRFADFLLRSTR